MLSPILNLVNKVSYILQSSNLDLHIAVILITALQKSLQTMWLDKSYNNIFKETKTTCTEINVAIHEMRKRQISTKLNYKHHSQNKIKFKDMNYLILFMN